MEGGKLAESGVGNRFPLRLGAAEFNLPTQREKRSQMIASVHLRLGLSSFFLVVEGFGWVFLCK